MIDWWAWIKLDPLFIRLFDVYSCMYSVCIWVEWRKHLFFCWFMNESRAKVNIHVNGSKMEQTKKLLLILHNKEVFMFFYFLLPCIFTVMLSLAYVMDTGHILVSSPTYRKNWSVCEFLIAQPWEAVDDGSVLCRLESSGPLALDERFNYRS